MQKRALFIGKDNLRKYLLRNATGAFNQINNFLVFNMFFSKNLDF